MTSHTHMKRTRLAADHHQWQVRVAQLHIVSAQEELGNSSLGLRTIFVFDLESAERRGRSKLVAEHCRRTNQKLT